MTTVRQRTEATASIRTIQEVENASTSPDSIVPGSNLNIISEHQYKLRGISLPLFYADPDYNYGELVHEIVDTGANSVSILIVLMMDHHNSSNIRRITGKTASDDTLRRTIGQVKNAEMEPLVFPIVLIQNPEEGKWRGNIEPDDPDEWFDQYRSWMAKYARISEEAGATWFCIGSELKSMESYSEEWVQTIDVIEEQFSGKLTYSANWDQLDGPNKWWQRMDAVGMSSYFELTDRKNPTREDLWEGWSYWMNFLDNWREESGNQLPFILTELGYPSMDGAAAEPWRWALDRPSDLEEQRLCYEVFVEVWSGRIDTMGVYFYKWPHFNDPPELTYSPKNKPAENVLRRWFSEQKSLD